MAQRAKLFQNGGSQAVRLPKACRFDNGQQEVIVHRVGRQVILEPVDAWPDDFLRCLGAWGEDIPRPRSRPIAARRNPFSRS